MKKNNLDDYVFLVEDIKEPRECASDFSNQKIVFGEDVLIYLHDTNLNELEEEEELLHFVYDNSHPDRRVYGCKKREEDKLLLLKEILGEDEILYNAIVKALGIIFYKEDIELLKYFDVEKLGWRGGNSWNPKFGFQIKVNDNAVELRASALNRELNIDDVFYLIIDRTQKKFSTNIAGVEIEGYLKKGLELKDKKIVEACFYDYSEYKPGLSRDGGCYSYWIAYVLKGGRYRKSYNTSAEIPYCNKCGNWGDHSPKYGCEYEKVTLEELKNILHSWYEDCKKEPNKYSMRIEYEDGSVQEF